MQDHYRKLQNMYLQNASINRFFDTTTLTVSEGKAEVSLMVDPKYFHAAGAMHGSVYFKLLDDAAFFAVNSLVEDVFVLTVEFKLHLVRPVSQGLIRSVGNARFQSRQLFVGESTLYDQKGREIGFGSGTFAKSKIILSPEIGYC